MEETPRPCLACGYNLEGLGQEPRCPECGLLNIPDGYRRQIWELVDSGKWFFSGFFSFFRKRPPGWWWALDRPGDVKHAMRFAILCACVASSIVFVAGAIAGSVVHTIHEVQVWTYPNRENTLSHQIYDLETSLRLAMEPIEESAWSGEIKVGPPPTPQRIGISTFRFTCGFFFPCVFLCGTLFLSWCFPAGVGIWTQIRKSLPSFARAPRTILAASLLESHRLVYAALFTAFLLSLDAFFRSKGYLTNPWGILAFDLSPLLVFAFGAMGWIGPLRSDYTKQLIRSTGHGLRIFIMYGLFLPIITLYAIVAFFYSLEALYG